MAFSATGDLGCEYGAGVTCHGLPAASRLSVPGAYVRRNRGRVAETNKKCLVGKGLDWVHGSALPPAFQNHYKNQPFLTLLLDVLRVPR